MYGTQTKKTKSTTAAAFENDVKMYGTQTKDTERSGVSGFENDVKMYGTQTPRYPVADEARLRMM